MTRKDAVDEDQVQPTYGLWESPLSAHRLASFGSLVDVAWDHSGTLVWLEQGPAGARLRFQPPGPDAPRDLTTRHTPRGRVGYGGGAFTVGHGYVYFVDGAGGNLYRQSLDGGPPRPLTPSFGGAAAPALSPEGRWLLYVHADGADQCLALVDAKGEHWPRRLIRGPDFFMSPCWHPSSDRVAWVDWNQPAMPWESSALHLATLDVPEDSLPRLRERVQLAGGRDESVLCPAFSPDGRTLAYLSDRDGWWQIHLHDLVTGASHPLTADSAEYGGPAWVQGLRYFSFTPDSRHIYAVRSRRGFHRLVRIDLPGGDQQEVPLDDELSALEQVSVSPQGDSLALLASGPSAPDRLLSMDFGGGARVRAWTSTPETPAGYFAHPVPVTWEGEDGGTVQGLFYPPTNPRFRGKGAPPLVVYIHSGPTSQAVAGFSPRLAFFTSRGFAVLAVNYRGSTGYGRVYRQALHGRWGELDVADVVSGAHHLSTEGQVDPARVILLGNSAGGTTALLALARNPELFRGAIVAYPVVDHLAMEGNTHPFEAHYNRSLLGPLPETKERYRERSPLARADQIRSPLLLFHGEEDRVVRREGSDALAEALRRAGVPVSYHVFPGEGHGFRGAETLRAYYRAVEAFVRTHVI